MNELFEETTPILTSDQRARVFISSTIEELKEERNAVINAVHDLKLHPIFFEEGARSNNPRDVYKALLEQSHIYIGIFWKQYGWIPPDGIISGIEDEYNLSERKPRLIYVKEAPEGRDPRLEALLQRIQNDGDLSYCKFKNEIELADKVKNDIMQLLCEHCGIESHGSYGRVKPTTIPDYLQILRKQMDSQGLILRENLIEEAKKKLQSKDKLVIIGGPGAGKTYFLGILAAELDAIYVSLKNKTTQQVCSYLANRLSMRRNLSLQNHLSEEDARAALQEEMANHSAILFFDDADQNPDTARVLLGLHFFNCHSVFAARSENADLFQGLPKFAIPPLSLEEVKKLLELLEIFHPPGELQRLYSSSEGNPLYIYYFTQNPVSPLPEGLVEYQNALWQKLSSHQKEIMNILAYSFSNLNLADLHALLNSRQLNTKTPMETKHVLDSAIPLIRQIEGHYEFFHMHFRDHVYEIAANDGLSEYYHKILAEYAADKKWIVATAFHYLKANDPRMRHYLIDGATTAMLRGEWLLAEDFLKNEILFLIDNEDLHNEAYARYLLGQIYTEIGDFGKARTEVDKSIQLFSKLEDNEWKYAVELWSSLLNLREGRAEKTIEILKEAVIHYHNRDLLQEATTQMNLGFAYLQVSRFRDCAEATQIALDIFTKLSDERGIYSSLINMACSVGQLGNHELQGKYAKQIIDAATKHDLPRLKAAGLNHLAMAYRHSDNPKGAQHALEECIAICQKLGCVETEVLNIANIGNAFRDQGLNDQAEKAYLESLTKAREHQLHKQEGFALELLSRLNHDKGLHDEAIRLGLQALEIHRKFGDNLRIASTQDYLARSYMKLNDYKSAAESYEDSAEHYEVTELWSDAAYNYEEAANIWVSTAQDEKALYCASSGAKCALLSGAPSRAAEIITEFSPNDKTGNFGDFYLRIIHEFIEESQSVSFSRFIINFSIYCKRHCSENIDLFKAGIESLIKGLPRDSHANLSNALAVGIEQSNEKIYASSGLDVLSLNIIRSFNHIHYRSIPGLMKLWTIGMDWQKPFIIQIRCISNEPIVERIAIALSLILYSNRSLIEKVISEQGGIQEEGFTLDIATQNEIEKQLNIKINPISIGEAMPASTTETRVPWDQPQPPTVLIIHDDYETSADWMTNPGNKAFVWLLMIVHGAFVAHCVHKERESMPDLARRSREFCETVLL
jgi:tetratricopeptide (TPR) repeat protein